jgi:hypothetical protein
MVPAAHSAPAALAPTRNATMALMTATARPKSGSFAVMDSR